MSANSAFEKRDSELFHAKEQLKKVVRREYEVPTHVFDSFSISDTEGLEALRSVIIEALGAIVSHNPKSHDEIESLIYRQTHNSDPLMTFDDSCDDIMFDAAFDLLNSLNSVDRAIGELNSGLLGKNYSERDDASELDVLRKSAFETLAVDQCLFPDTWPWCSTSEFKHS